MSTTETKQVPLSEIKNRLVQKGLKKDEIDALIDEYLEVPGENTPNEAAIKSILKKNQESERLRVRGFKLTQSQYDLFVNYFEEKEEGVPGDIDASELVNRVLTEFGDLIS